MIEFQHFGFRLNLFVGFLRMECAILQHVMATMANSKQNTVLVAAMVAGIAK